MRRRAAGFTLIELMIAITIGLIVTLAAMTVLADSEGRRRTQSSVAGLDQSAQFVSYVIDSQLRSAGSGFAQSWRLAFGCKLNGAVSGTTLFPLPTLAPPFASVAATMGAFRLAPVIILKGASAGGSDVLVVTAGTAGYGEIALPFANVPSANALNLQGTASLNPNDLMLVADQNVGNTVAPCLLEQSASGFAGGTTISQVSLAGAAYALASGTDRNLTDFTADGVTIPLGNLPAGSPASANPPTMTLLGVGGTDPSVTTSTGSNLYSYNLLKAPGTANVPVAIAEGVVEMRALYGIDTTGSGLVDSWQDPGTGNFAPAKLLDGSVASAQRLASIRAIRVGMILRTSLVERQDQNGGQAVSPSTLTLFPDLPQAESRSLTGAQNYRYRVVDTTVPLRNLLLTSDQP